MIALAP